MPVPLTGIVPPLITPLTVDGLLDVGATERLLEHIIAGGVSGVFILGTTGEGPCIPSQIQEALIREVVRSVRGRIPVLVGITSAVLEDSLRLARVSLDAGADACVWAPPFYLPAGPAQLRRNVELLLKQLPLPLFLYNMPSLVKTPIPLELVKWSLDQPGVVGIKDSCGQFGYFHQVLQLARARADYTVLIGPEELLADALVFGAHGGVAGGSQIFPELFVALHHAVREGNLTRIRRLNDAVQAIARHLHDTSGYAASVVRGIKVALQLRGFAGDTMSEPFGPASEAERDRVRAALDAIGPVIEASLG
jgi:4-hydroxy-tetrahydrodipicolinate synthase